MRHVTGFLIWSAINKQKEFDVGAIAEICECSESTVLKYCQQLLAQGSLEVINSRRNGTAEKNRYRLLKEALLPPGTNEDGRDKIWRSIRIKRHFTITELVATSGASDTVAEKFTARLLKMSVVRVACRNESGKKGSFFVYQLTRDLGPRTPIPLSDGRLFDCNSCCFLG